MSFRMLHTIIKNALHIILIGIRISFKSKLVEKETTGNELNTFFIINI